jgi:hypothetical protein
VNTPPAPSQIIGAATLRLRDVMGPLKDSRTERAWEGWVPLSSKPAKKDKQGQIAMGAAAGQMIFGPAGAMVGGWAASLWEGGVEGKVAAAPACGF